MDTALVAAATALVVYWLTTYHERRKRWEDRRGDTYVDLLTLVQDFKHDMNPYRKWVADYGPDQTPPPDLTDRDRAIIEAKVTAWGSQATRSLLDDLHEQAERAKRNIEHHMDVVDRARTEGFAVDGNYNLGAVAENAAEIDKLAERIAATVRAELQPSPSWWAKLRSRTSGRKATSQPPPGPVAEMS